ncbi:MAG: RluA family pseudouridine synthase [Candidatus Magasanikbacteria bacterium]|nr:RluA family pseudouridine synthase [Candidatus Magasanikbacteria bacterium]
MPALNQKIILDEESKKKRLDLLLSEKLGISRSQIEKMIKRGGVLVDGKLIVKAGKKLISANEITFQEIEERKSEVQIKKEENFDVTIIKEESDYLVVEKPAGLLIHPTEALEKVTMAGILLEKYPELKGVGEGKLRPGIVHRLDKDASGLLVVAKNQKMYEHLKKQFQNREVEKIYKVLVYGIIETDQEIIDFEIDRGRDGRMVSRPTLKKLTLRTVRDIQEGRKAKTEFWVEKRFGRFSFLKIKIYSGRTHQIRVHMYAYNHPVVGDNIYFNKNLFKKQDKLERLFLHSARLGFKDFGGKYVVFESELPEKLQNFLNKLR